MSKKFYNEEFKRRAVEQILVQRHTINFRRCDFDPASIGLFPGRDATAGILDPTKGVSNRGVVEMLQLDVVVIDVLENGENE